jgi:hypothetical protein
LRDSFAPLDRFSGPGWRAELDYHTGGRGPGVKLGLWRSRAFERFSRSRLGRLVPNQRCTRVERSRLAGGGEAVIYGGYSSPPERCGRGAPDRYFAHVFLDGVVVTVNVPFCFCVLQRRDLGGAYDTLRGMRTVAANLRLRPPAP